MTKNYITVRMYCRDGALVGEADRSAVDFLSTIPIHRATTSHDRMHRTTRQPRTENPVSAHVFRRRHLPGHLSAAHGTRGI